MPPPDKIVADPSAAPAAAAAATACDLCVIGAGSGGLSVAAAAAAFGEKVVLIEKNRMGGDCLNTGCVPSKALIAAGKRAHAMRTSGPFGVRPVAPEVDLAAVERHVRGVIAAIAPNDSVERFTGLGVEVIQATGRFVDRQTVAAGDRRIKARRFVIATGSSPLVPSIPGLDTVPYFTNETIFANTEPLERLIVIGGGPIGIELAQAYMRLGSRVVVLEAKRALAKDDAEMTAGLLELLRQEGLDIRENTPVSRVEGRAGALRVTIEADGRQHQIEGTHILVAAGRTPNIADLGLEAGGISFSRSGITVDSGLRTSNRSVMAIGDCIGGPQFTHVANYHAGIAIRRVLFRLPVRVDPRLIPWVTYTEPELAHVGLSEAEARRQRGRIEILRWPFYENDRAQAELATEGFVKVVTDSRGRILGATILGAQAGELIQMWSLAISQRLGIGAMTGFISPYPTLAEVNKRVAIRAYAAAAASPLVRRLIGWLKALP